MSLSSELESKLKTTSKKIVGAINELHDAIPPPPVYANASLPSGTTGDVLSTIFLIDPHELVPNGTAYTIGDFLAFVEIPNKAERAAFYAAGGSFDDQFAGFGGSEVYIVTVDLAKPITAAINFRITVFYRKSI